MRLLSELGVVERISAQEARARLPQRPGLRRTRQHGRIRTREPPVIGAHHVGALLRWDRLDVLLPQIRVERAGAARVLVKPFKLPAAQQKNPAQYQLRYLLR